jgi:hypothetical protein
LRGFGLNAITRKDEGCSFVISTLRREKSARKERKEAQSDAKVLSRNFFACSAASLRSLRAKNDRFAQHWARKKAAEDFGCLEQFTKYSH